MAYKATFFQRSRLQKFATKHAALARRETDPVAQESHFFLMLLALGAIISIDKGPSEADEFVRKLDRAIEESKRAW